MSFERILIVADNSDAARILETALNRLGHGSIGTAVSIKEALELARRASPDLIVMDLHLQGPMGGIAAIERIRQDHPIPVIFTVKVAERLSLERARRMQPFGYLFEPLRECELQTCLELAMQRRKMEQELAGARQQAQYHAFQAGVAEMSTSILHNIGNAIMSITYRALRLEESGEELEETARLLDGAKKLFRKKREQGRSEGEILTELLEVLAELSDDLLRTARDRLLPDSRQIRSSVDHISDIIKIHQDSAHPRGVFSQFNLRELLEDAVAIQADTLKKYGIEVQIDLADGLHDVTLPRSQLLQLCINLVKNSKEAIEERNKRETIRGKVLISVQGTPDGLELSIADNGCGIPAETMPNLFSYGYSTKERGTGFGLHSAALFVQSLSGSIEAHSAGPDQGAVLTIGLPLKGACRARAMEADSATGSKGTHHDRHDQSAGSGHRR
ncbi:MAG: hybrid sensor histidine kinase/response regulator [Magnetococcales bacterium]|nr:hybrid sensor histidine kinase/response regulator [Magnetococcales bacterium]